MGNAPLKVLGMHGGVFGSVDMLLELRSQDDPEFIEYNPDAMHVALVEWIEVAPLPDGSADIGGAYDQIEAACASTLSIPLIPAPAPCSLPPPFHTTPTHSCCNVLPCV
jgi:hypothetical protein